MVQTIAVIGGGITGVTTAYALMLRGYSVTLFERHRYAAMETCEQQIEGGTPRLIIGKGVVVRALFDQIEAFLNPFDEMRLPPCCLKIDLPVLFKAGVINPNGGRNAHPLKPCQIGRASCRERVSSPV